MKAQIKLGKIFGIEIGLHYSWLIIAVLISLSLVSYFGSSHPDWSTAIIWSMALFSALLFFVAILLHELSHSLVALRNGLTVRSITLFALGGVANIENEPKDAKSEFWMAIVGPITSAAIGLVCLGSARLAGWTILAEPETPLIAIIVWLGLINIALAVFNMIPGFPMDGGRVLRAVIWWITGNAARATRSASITGQIVAIGFIMLGLLSFFRGSGFSGLWIAFIGWFLLNAAKATYAQEEIKENLGGVLVGDLMTQDCPVVSSLMNLQSLVDENLLRTGQRCFIVADGDETLGLITPHEIKDVAKKLWAFKSVGDVMKPIEQLHTVTPETPVTEALEIIGREDVNQLPVVSGRRLEGIVSRDHILRYLLTRRELNL